MSSRRLLSRNTPANGTIEVVHVAGAIGFGGLLVALEGQLVLLGAG